MENGKDLLLLLTALASEDQLLEELEDALKNFKITKTDDAKKKLHMMCLVFASKRMVGDDIDGALKSIKRLDEIEARDKLHTPHKS